MRNILLSSLIISLLMLLLLNLAFGTYFEGYEPIWNAMLVGEFCSQMDYTFFMPNWFGILPFISFINHYFNTSYAYAIITSGINLFLLISFTACFWVLFKRENFTRRQAILFYAMFILVFAENLVYVYNVRISFFCGVGAYLVVFLIKRYQLTRRYYLTVILLLALSIIARLEVGAVTSISLLFLSITCCRRMLGFSLVFVLFSCGTLTFYKFYQHKVFPEQETLLEIEHVFEDRRAIVPEDVTDHKTQLMLKAISNYAYDDEVFTMPMCAEIMGKQSLWSYVSSPGFSTIYWDKLKELIKLLSDYLWVIFLSLILSGYTAYRYWAYNAYGWKAMFKIVALAAFIPMLVLGLSIWINCPHTLIVVLFMGLFVLCLMHIIIYRSRFNLTFLPIFLIVFQIPLSAFYFYHLHSYQEQIGLKAMKCRQMLTDLRAEKKEIVIMDGLNEEYYPSKLFSTLLKRKIPHYYANHFLSRYRFFTKHNERFFGAGNPYMRVRMEAVSDNNGVVCISNDGINEFLKEYMRVFHKLELNFQEIKMSSSCDDLRAYNVFAFNIASSSNTP